MCQIISASSYTALSPFCHQKFVQPPGTIVLRFTLWCICCNLWMACWTCCTPRKCFHGFGHGGRKLYGTMPRHLPRVFFRLTEGQTPSRERCGDRWSGNRRRGGAVDLLRFSRGRSRGGGSLRTGQGEEAKENKFNSTSSMLFPVLCCCCCISV